MDSPTTIRGNARATFDGIERRRLRISLSVGRLCRRADISEAAYRKLLTDEARRPNFRTISRLAAAIADFERTP